MKMFKMDCGDSWHNTGKTLKSIELYTLKVGKLLVFELYLNKAVIKQ